MRGCCVLVGAHIHGRVACEMFVMASAGAVSSAASKCIDVSNMEIIHRGKQWDRAEDPCAKSVIHLLERNEGLVTWLQPKVTGVPLVVLYAVPTVHLRYLLDA